MNHTKEYDKKLFCDYINKYVNIHILHIKAPGIDCDFSKTCDEQNSCSNDQCPYKSKE